TETSALSPQMPLQFSSEYFVLSGIAAENAPKTLGCMMLDKIPNQSSCTPPQLKPQFATSRFSWPENLSQAALSFSSIFFLGKSSQNFLVFAGTAFWANSPPNRGSITNPTKTFDSPPTYKKKTLAEAEKQRKINCLIKNDGAPSPANIMVMEVSKLVNLVKGHC